MYFDGSLKLEDRGAGVLLISPTGEQLKYVLQIFWKVSNNESEYEALLHRLRLAISLGIKRLLVDGDSTVVINQVNKSWDRNKENMDAYFLEVRKLENKLYGLDFHHVARDNNVAADVLSKLGSTRAQVPAGVFVHELHTPSIPEPVPTTTDPAPSQAGQEDRRGLATTLHRLHPRAEGSHGQELGRANHPPGQVLRTSRRQALQVGYHFWSTHEVCSLRRRQGHLGEIHKGICGNHASSRTLVSKAFRRAFYCPIALGDAEELVRRCQGCQYFLQATTRPGLQASHYTTNLAFRLLGARHDWASPNCARRIQQSLGGYRQVHQVDRSQAGYLSKGQQGT
jgi:ribonuclease HI